MDRGRYEEALASFRDGLARLHKMGDRPRLEMTIRLNLCELYLTWGRLPDAEDEVRRAEESAIQNNFSRQLVRLYVIMGKLRGLEGDETGFVFFEKAVELAQGGGDPSPRMEAEIYRAYAEFRRQIGEAEEARALLERARELLDKVGDGVALAKVDEELSQLNG
jgi:tetratricopeptide (TPR) repeat protein